MLFSVHWGFAPQHRDKVNARFKESGGLPPKGVKMLGRWHAVGGNEGFLICEADDPIRLGLWMQDWSDLLTFRVLPVVDDESVSRVLAGG